jgi:hypothetical protein
MKTLILTTVFAGITSFAMATTINAPSGMIGSGALNGSYAYTWTVASGDLVPGEEVDYAKITFTNIKWTSGGSGKIIVDFGRVFSGMTAAPNPLPTPGNYGRYWDNDAAGDAFSQNIVNGNAVNLGTKPLSYGVLTSWDYTFTAGQLSSLNSFADLGNWGFLIDPDCRFDVGGIKFDYTTKGGGGSVPDGGITVILLGAAMLGLGWAKRRVSA